MRLSNTAEVIFDNVEIPAFNLIGTEEGGFANAMKVLTASRPIIAASSLGACQLARDLAIQYSKERDCFWQADLCKTDDPGKDRQHGNADPGWPWTGLQCYHAS